MTVEEARKLYEKYKKELAWNNDHTNEEALTEITGFLLRKTGDPWYSMDLGGYYYGCEKYDLAQKYYELAYEQGDCSAALCLGYIWYYGRTGMVDYEKAFRYFNEAAEQGEDEAKRKIADMYKNGYYVPKDYERSCEIIESLYEAHKNDLYAFEQLPDLCTRLAEIRRKQGRIQEAVHLYLQAKKILPQRMKYTEFFGDVNVMDWLICHLYEISDPDYADLDLFDLLYVLKKPGRAVFHWNGNPYEMISVMEEGEYAVQFLGHWYRSMNDLFRKARLNGKPLYVCSDEIYDVEVRHG